jgi:hypothetical protein
LIYLKIEWTFTTKSLDPLTIFVKVNNQVGRHKIVLERLPWALFIELISKIGVKFNVHGESIQSIIFEGTDVSIENDMDVLQLQNEETIEVTFYSL